MASCMVNVAGASLMAPCMMGNGATRARGTQGGGGFPRAFRVSSPSRQLTLCLLCHTLAENGKAADPTMPWQHALHQTCRRPPCSWGLT